MNLADIIDDHPADHPAVICGGTITTYGQLGERVARLRGGLSTAGIGRDDRVVLIAANNMTFVESYLAIVGLGAVMVPLSSSSPPAEIARQVEVIDPMAVILDATAARTWPWVECYPASGRRLVIAPAGAVDDCTHTIEQLLGSDPAPAVAVDDDTPAVWMFTSGTAGPPNVARLTHGNLLANLNQLSAVPGELTASDVVYGVIPLNHIYGLNVVLGSTLKHGATLVLAQRFDPSTALDSIRDRGVTVVLGVPPMWREFLNLAEAPDDAFAGVNLATSGAAALPAEISSALCDRFGLEIAEGYGLTEASPVVTTSVGLPWRPGSVGRAVPGMEIRLVDGAGNDVPFGDAGEIWLRGPNVFIGYLDAEATARVFADDGWLRTGDIGTVDQDGNLYLVDRSKDLVIVSGFNVYPAEVEAVLDEHPDIVDAAVVGVSHPATGEAVKAYVVRRPGATLDEEAVIMWTEDRLARYKCPSKVLFVDQLPRATSGKILRRELV